MDQLCHIGATVYLNSRCQLMAAALFSADPAGPQDRVSEIAQLRPTEPEKVEKIWIVLSPEDLSRFVTSGKQVTCFDDGVCVPAYLEISEDFFLMRGWFATGREDCGAVGRLLQALHDRDWFMETDFDELNERYRTADFDSLDQLW